MIIKSKKTTNEMLQKKMRLELEFENINEQEFYTNYLPSN